MKRVLLVLSVLWVATATAEDSWLYWMLGNDTGYTAAESGSADKTYTKVQIRGYAVGGDAQGSLLDLYYDASTPLSPSTYVSATTISEMNGFGAGLYAKLANNTTYSSFVIELVNDSGFVADSERLTAASAAAFIETANSMHSPSAWAPVSYSIPEPNSAMLLLLGCAALGLRRRRQLKA